VAEFAVELVLAGKLHDHWPTLKRGLDAIIRKTPNVRWIAEDVYAALANQTAFAFQVWQLPARRYMGFFIVHPQNVGFSDKTELFCWAAWTIPLREREPGDDVEGSVRCSIEHMVKMTRDGGHVALTFLTARKAWRRGKRRLPYFSEAFTAYRININSGGMP
jgi:hypothetical protein